jgi:hypothetical protein
MKSILIIAVLMMASCQVTGDANDNPTNEAIDFKIFELDINDSDKPLAMFINCTGFIWGIMNNATRLAN